jgi:hypothetical protein
MKQGLVAKDEMQDHPGCSGTQYHGREHGSVQVAQNFFERKQHGRDRCIEGRRQRRRGANRQQRFDIRFTQAEAPAQHGSDAGADLHRRPFASERDTARQRNGTSDKFPDDGAQRYVSVLNK